MPNPERLAMIATLPKSGTWYCHTFFWFYDRLLRHSDEYSAGKYTPDLLGVLRDRKIGNQSSHSDTFGVDRLFIGHVTCPGFPESHDELDGIWQALHFPLPYDWGQEHLRKHGYWDALNPKNNPDARIIYLYRNPLDHFVSYYAHTRTHAQEAHRFHVLPDGSRVEVDDLHAFVFEMGALGAFIKHYYSFHRMRLLYPNNVLLIPYERLAMQPEAAFAEILGFLGAAPDSPVKQRLFKAALAMCSKEALSAIESTLEGSLVGDQVAGAKHIRGGEIGKWKKAFSDEEIERIESVFAMFDMSLRDFTLSGDDEGIHLAEVDTACRERHQKHFLEQQLCWTGAKITALTQKNALLTEKLDWAESEIRRLDLSVWQSFKRSRVAAPLRLMRRSVKSAFAGPGKRS